MEDEALRVGRSLEGTPTWSVATVTTVMVFLCFFVERSIFRFGRWLEKTRRKALYASLEKIKEELMLLGLISLLLGQWARWITQICVSSSLYNSKFYICSQEDYSSSQRMHFQDSSMVMVSSNHTEDIHPHTIRHSPHHFQCGEGREPFISTEGLEQLHRFLFVLAITHVLYSFIAVGLSMSKIYSWKKWENQVSIGAESNNLPAKCKVMRRQSTFALNHTLHPWARSPILIWMLCFLRQFRSSSILKSDYLALRLGFINNHKLPLSYNFHKYIIRSMEDEFYEMVGISWPLWGYAIICMFVNIHGLNIYLWLSFIPITIVMVIGTKLQHVMSLLALEIAEPKVPVIVGTQVEPHDGLFWFGKPEILLRLIQFVSFQNAFEMATFIWTLWGFQHQSCFVKNHSLLSLRLTSGVLVQLWCSYSTIPLNVIISQMGSRCRKALIAESVRESLQMWCKRVKQRSKRGTLTTTTSAHSFQSIIKEGDEATTMTLSPSSSLQSLNVIDKDGFTNQHGNGDSEISYT
ncbi:unnamed protein product [Cuscuta epithymum]|uniref:MLO-like protein n=1 Tax=Cuscuta epithymum TaxID=186058 RepID=A0AAV0CUJ3_9ASTE|nr:unnamed protein product [Cuscuta epithymum]CAH9130732.1 unnamed protein product [Cuscuta epithymum]